MSTLYQLNTVSMNMEIYIHFNESSLKIVILTTKYNYKMQNTNIKHGYLVAHSKNAHQNDNNIRVFGYHTNPRTGETQLFKSQKTGCPVCGASNTKQTENEKQTGIELSLLRQRFVVMQEDFVEKQRGYLSKIRELEESLAVDSNWQYTAQVAKLGSLGNQAVVQSKGLRKLSQRGYQRESVGKQQYSLKEKQIQMERTNWKPNCVVESRRIPKLLNTGYLGDQR